jgi:hypothetical protein
MFELTNKPTNNVTVSHCCSLWLNAVSKSLIVQHLAYIVSPARDEQKNMFTWSIRCFGLGSQFITLKLDC